VGRKHLILPARLLCQKELVKSPLLVLDQQEILAVLGIRVLVELALVAGALAVYFLAAVIWLEAHPEGMGVEQVVLVEKLAALEVVLV
jgi:hypothetical protein